MSWLPWADLPPSSLLMDLTQLDTVLVRGPGDTTLRSRLLSSFWQFSRASAATFIGSDGLIQLTPQSRNLFVWSQDFDNAAWTKTNCAVTPDQAPAPDGSQSADMLIANAGTFAPQMAQGSVGTVNGTTYNTSFFVAPDWPFVQLAVNGQNADFCNFTLSGAGSVQNNGGAVGSISFDAATGFYRIAMTYTAGGTDRRPILALVPSGTATRFQTRTWAGTEWVTIWGAQLEVVPNANLVLGPELVTNGDFSQGSTGWTQTPAVGSFEGGVFSTAGANTTLAQNSILSSGRTYRLSFDIVSRASGTLFSAFGAHTSIGALSGLFMASSANLSFAFTGVPVLSVDNVSVREVTSIIGMPTAYTRNAGGLFPPRIDHDPVTLAPRGLLIEGWRTNLLLNSLLNGANLATQNVTVTATAHTLSFYGTGTVTLSGAHSATVNGTGAYPQRTTLTFTPSAGTLIVTVSGTVQFAQLEAGASASSFIPTGASQVTRVVDNAAITGTNLSDWFNQGPGTFLAEAFVPHAVDVYVWSTGGNRIALRRNNPNLVTLYNRIGGSFDANLGLTGNPFQGTFRAATAVQSGSSAISAGAGTLATNSGAFTVSENQLFLGSLGGGSHLFGHIRRIQYWPTRLTNAQLQTISGPQPTSIATASASGSVPLTGTASSLAIAAASAFGPLPLEGTAAAVPVASAAAAAPLPLEGTALADLIAAAAASAFLPLAGSGSAAAVAAARASGVLPLGGAALADLVADAAAIGLIPLEGSAFADLIALADAQGALPLSGSANLRMFRPAPKIRFTVPVAPRRFTVEASPRRFLVPPAAR